MSNKSIRRLAMMGIYLTCIALISWVASRVYVYFHTGAEFGNEIYLLDEETYSGAYITWSDITGQVGTEVPEHIIDKIEKDYRTAWFVYNAFRQSGNKKALEPHFGQSIIELMDSVKSKDLPVKQVDLSHSLEVLSMSSDYQLATIRSKHSRLKQVFQLNKESIHFMDQDFSYTMLLRLVDGFWKIESWQRTITDTQSGHFQEALNTTISNIRGINYYPGSSPWFESWTNFEADTLQRDARLMKNLGINTVRIFVPYEVFGGPNPEKQHLDNLKMLLDIMHDQGIQVVTTLFDFLPSYKPGDLPYHERHIRSLVNAVGDHPAMLMWDIKNEPDLDFESHSKDVVIGWLNHMVNFLHQIDSMNAVTIGWSDPEYIILDPDVDVRSFHYYNSIENLPAVLEHLLPSFNYQQPLLCSEFGLATYNSFILPGGVSEQKQQEQMYLMRDLFEKHGIGQMTWTLHDFDHIPGYVTGLRKWRAIPQKNFGIIRQDGSRKPVATMYQNVSTTSKPNSRGLPRFYITCTILLMSLLALFASRKRLKRQLFNFR